MKKLNSLNNFSVVFRCDASIEIGSGHVMRCLTLAEALRSAGAICHFLCRALEGSLIGRIKARGFTVSEIAYPDSKDVPKGYSTWMGGNEALDARSCRVIIDDICPDWVVVDHYSFGSDWVAEAATKDCMILFVDDLADRDISCDIVLNQNLGASAEQYDGLVGSDTLKLIGPCYALLRPEFRIRRSEKGDGLKGSAPSHLLIAFGGTDPFNATQQTLECINNGEVVGLSRITVLLDTHAPYLFSIQETARKMRIPTRVLSGDMEMGRVLLDVDLAVGAAGTSVWERCAMGIPSLLLVLADNQRAGTQALVDAGAGLSIGELAFPKWTEQLLRKLNQALIKECWDDLRIKAASVCDGRGTERVVAAVNGCRLTLRPALSEDAKLIWAWRQAGGEYRYYRNSTPTDVSDHMIWFENALIDDSKILLVAELGSSPLAHLRFDVERENTTSVEISICIDAKYRGQGYGNKVLRLGIDYARKLNFQEITAEIHKDNGPSIAIFTANGFLKAYDCGDFLTYRNPLSA